LAAFNGTLTHLVPPERPPPERQPARIMMINLGYPPNTVGGTEVLVQSLARALVHRGSSVSVVSLSTSGADGIDDDEGVRAYFIAAHPMGIALLDPQRTAVKKLFWHALGEFNIWSAGKLAAIVEQEKPDIIHTHSLLGLSTSLWRVARAHGIPIAHTLHDYQLLCPRGTMFRDDRPCDRQCETCRWLTVRRRRDSVIPDAVIGISECILRMHCAQGYFPNAVRHVIPNGLGPAGNENSENIRRPRGPAYPWRIGFIGRLHPIKGVGLFIDAFKELPSGTCIGKIAGSGNAEYQAQLKARALGHPIEFLGWVRPEKFYSEIDLLVVPSLYNEPQGLVLLEAARMGIPVIYSNRGGLAEMGEAFPDFTAFDPAIPGSLGKALCALVAAPPTETLASFPLPARFARDTFVESYRQLYDGLRARTVAG
jgi:glycosyltransferase involved in cell wall biosynthesis